MKKLDKNCPSVAIAIYFRLPENIVKDFNKALTESGETKSGFCRRHLLKEINKLASANK